MSTIIALDPGLTTGIVVVNNIDYATCEYQLEGYKALPFKDRAKLLILLKQYDDLDAIVMENFLLYPDQRTQQAQTYSDFPSVKVIERVTVYAEQLGIADKIVLQMASLRKNVQIPTDHYKELAHYSKHCVDAYRHARYYIRVNRNGPKVTT